MKSTSRSPEAKAWQHLYNTSRWRKLRLLHLASEPLCRMCKQTDRLTPATVVDHIKAHKGDETLFWDQGNWQSLCKPCHDSDAQSRDKTGREKPIIGVDGWPKAGELHLGDMSHPAWLHPLAIPLTIVCGPPASGKTTYVAQHKGERDVVLDLDVIAVRMFGKGVALLSKDQLMACLKNRNEQLRDLASPKASATFDMAWLIVSEPDARKRQWWADKLRPSEIIVIETHPSTCTARARADKVNQRPTNVGQTIKDWWATYTRRPGERTIAV